MDIFMAKLIILPSVPESFHAIKNIHNYFTMHSESENYLLYIYL